MSGTLVSFKRVIFDLAQVLDSYVRPSVGAYWLLGYLHEVPTSRAALVSGARGTSMLQPARR